MTRTRRSTALAVAATATLAGTPAALARPDAARSPDVHDLAARAHDQLGPDLRTPDARDFGAHRRIVASTPVKVVEIHYVPRSGFDTTDAAIGAGGALGVILIGAGAAVAVRRRREPVDLLPAR